MISDKSNLIATFMAVLITVLYCGAVFADQAPAPPDNQTSTGPLVIPSDEEPGVEKKCLTVCEKWGEACSMNPRTGSRRCRRVCKQLGKECI
jgi:hypothetical protein